MWFGIVFAVVVEIVPLHLRSTTIGAFLFVMNNIGGNLPILVEPTRRAIGFRGSLYIFYAGFYGLSKYLKNPKFYIKLKILIDKYELTLSYIFI